MVALHASNPKCIVASGVDRIPLSPSGQQQTGHFCVTLVSSHEQGPVTFMGSRICISEVRDQKTDDVGVAIESRPE